MFLLKQDETLYLIKRKEIREQKKKPEDRRYGDLSEASAKGQRWRGKKARK